MRQRRKLRLRVAAAFTGLGALISLMFAVGIWLAAHDVSQRLIDETLTAELADYLARRARNPASLPPASASLRGYVAPAGSAASEVPSAIRRLAPGRHEVALDGVHWRVVVADTANGDRHYVLFSEERQRRREQRFLGWLLGGTLLMTLLAAAGGYWLAGRVTAPVLERERAFAADASHELRTPLAVIRGAAEVLAEDAALGEAQLRRVARIERAAAEMSELTTALLLLAREQEAPVDEPCDCAAVARASVERHGTLADQRHHRLELIVEATPRLDVAAAYFAIVVDNLVRNALGHAGEGDVSVHLHADRLVVRDEGSGIPIAELERVFERNYRGAASAGSGIGLSLVKRICDRHGWRIELASAQAGGTTATLIFRA